MIGRLPAAAALATSLLLLTAACRRHGFPQYPADYREFAYVTNTGADTVTVLDLVHLRQERVVAVGHSPTGATANPTRNEVYIVNTGSNSISVLDTETNRVVGTIPVHKRPYFIDVDRAGARGYVADAGSNDVAILDLAARRVVATASAGEAPGVARVARDGSAIVVSNRASGSVSVIDTHSLRLRAAFPGCPQATEIAILPDSSKAFVACSGSHQVMALGLAHAANAMGPAEPDRLLTMLDVGQTPVDLALKPDGGEIFVSNFGGETISEIATGTDEVGGAYVVGAQPVRALVSADNTLLWVANFAANTIAVYSIDDGKLIHTVEVGDGPDAMAFSADGHLLLSANARSGDVSVVRTLSRAPGGATVFGSLFTMLPTGKQPSSIAVKAFRITR